MRLTKLGELGSDILKDREKKKGRKDYKAEQGIINFILVGGTKRRK